MSHRLVLSGVSTTRRGTCDIGSSEVSSHPHSPRRPPQASPAPSPPPTPAGPIPWGGWMCVCGWGGLVYGHLCSRTKCCTTLPGGLTGPPTRGRSRAYLFQGARKVGPPIPPPLPPCFVLAPASAVVRFRRCGSILYLLFLSWGEPGGRGRSGLSGIAEPGPWDLRAGRSGRSVVPFSTRFSFIGNIILTRI